ncbi:MAG TPA: glycosyltransferase, partial [Cyclobacteriaceae bacterium]|nr:glycosyltransferase [Cyclobacteriaceae bacterium]
CTSNAYTCIISDHRYGCYHPRVHSIFLSHQLQPRMSSGLAFLQALFNRLHRQQLKHFNSFWVPDFPDEQKLSGELSAFKSENLRYIGLLSRLPQQVKAVKRFKYIALLSGPEPQRKILEDKLRKQLMNLQQATLLIRGKAGEDTEIETNGLYSEVGYLEGKVLAQLLLGAELIIARPGYSTIMDLAALGKSAVFIPTPGQTEQQYLAKILKQKGIAHYVEQHNFDLKQALIQSANFTGFNIAADYNLLTEAIKQIPA